MAILVKMTGASCARAGCLPPQREQISRLRSAARQAFMFMVLVAALLGSPRCGFGADLSLSEYQVKSLFLFNFAKYVEWPTNTFATATDPIVIGVIGEGKLGPNLARTVVGKRVDGRPIIIRPMRLPEDWGQCHILFIGAEEKTGVLAVLNQIKAQPILTVGESEQFLEQGGVIKFVKKEGRIRLEIDLESARNAKLRISSKLLSVADVVKGK